MMFFFNQNEPKGNSRCSLILIIFFGIFCFIGEVSAHGWMAPKSAANKKNPLTADRNSVDSGKDVYVQFCAVCHGENAEGRSKENAGTQTDPPNLKKRLNSHSDGDFFWKIQNGKKDMPSFKADLQDKEIWSVILFLRDLMQ